MLRFLHQDFIPQHDGSNTFQDLTSTFFGRKAKLQPHCTKPYTGQVTAPAAMERPPWRRALRADAVPLRLGVGTWW